MPLLHPAFNCLNVILFMKNIFERTLNSQHFCIYNVHFCKSFWLFFLPHICTVVSRGLMSVTSLRARARLIIWDVPIQTASSHTLSEAKHISTWKRCIRVSVFVLTDLRPVAVLFRPVKSLETSGSLKGNNVFCGPGLKKQWWQKSIIIIFIIRDGLNHSWCMKRKHIFDPFTFVYSSVSL